MKYLLIILSFFVLHLAVAQDAERFITEIEQSKNVQHRIDPEKETLVFAGSSSFRMWSDVVANFPEYNVINSGFGGSHMSDLLYYADQLILAYHPDKVFIYEGDNDLEYGKSPDDVLATFRELVEKIHADLPAAEIFILSAKPSPARWHLKKEYEALNKLYDEFASKHPLVEYIDVWHIMLNETGTPDEALFIEDEIHMNEKGYSLWAGLILQTIETN